MLGKSKERQCKSGLSPHPDGGLSHLRPGGWGWGVGGKMTTHPTSKTKRDRKAVENAFDYFH